MSTLQHRALLVGSSNRKAGLGAFLAAGIVIATHLLLVGAHSIAGASFTSSPFVITMGLITLGIATAYAYLDDGLIICVLLATAPVFGWVLHDFTISAPAPSGIDLLRTSLATSAIVGVPIGFTGFVLGACTRRLRDRR